MEAQQDRIRQALELRVDLLTAGHRDQPFMIAELDRLTPFRAIGTATLLHSLIEDRERMVLGDMEKGNLRADVNVSVRRPGAPLGTRCEIKNVNSIRFLGQAIEYEARRQIGVLEDGGSIEQETRLFDADRGETRPMRNKEEAHDYRYLSRNFSDKEDQQHQRVCLIAVVSTPLGKIIVPLVMVFEC